MGWSREDEEPAASSGGAAAALGPSTNKRIPKAVPWTGPVPERHHKYLEQRWWKAMQGEPVRFWLAEMVPVPLREVARMAGAREDFWRWSFKGLCKALAAVLRFEVPEAWPIGSLCSELRQCEPDVFKTILQSRGRFKLVVVPEFGPMILSQERDPAPDLDRDEHGRKKRKREERGERSAPRPRDYYED